MIEYSEKTGRYLFTTNGVCATKIGFEVEDGRVHKIIFHGGCPGNGRAVSSLCEGQKIDWIINRVKHITCGEKPTSCSMQLAEALEEVKELLNK